MASTTFYPVEEPARHVPEREVGILESIKPLLPAVILFYTTLLPQEMRIALADQTFYAYRVAWLLFFPWVLMQIVRGHLRFHPIDALVLAGAGWMTVSFVGYYGFDDWILKGLALSLDAVVPYLIARLCIRNLEDLRMLLIAVAPGLIACGLVIMLESVSRTYIVRPIASSIFGSLPAYSDGLPVSLIRFEDQLRLGFLRAQGPFAHPILAGMVLTSLLPLYFYSGLRRWPWIAGVAAGVLSFFTLSSAAIFGLVMFVGMMAYDWTVKAIRFVTWRMGLFFGLLAAIAIEVGANGGLIRVLIRLTLDPVTGYYRLRIWEYGWASVERNPLFGIGYTNYERTAGMTASIDAMWLALAVRHGLFISICLLTAFLVTMGILSWRSAKLGESERKMILGIVMALAITTVLSFTAAFFGGAGIWFYMLIGLGVSIVATGIGKVPAERSSEDGIG